MTTVKKLVINLELSNEVLIDMLIRQEALCLTAPIWFAEELKKVRADLATLGYSADD